KPPRSMVARVARRHLRRVPTRRNMVGQVSSVLAALRWRSMAAQAALGPRVPTLRSMAARSESRSIVAKRRSMAGRVLEIDHLSGLSCGWSQRASLQVASVATQVLTRRFKRDDVAQDALRSPPRNQAGGQVM
ncbi:MAG: hypothetical protein KAI47_08240, partial [Deltaproteobacteria bacterium]|nr:hypothetical protein [Deltaproteobacteria bacterium]